MKENQRITQYLGEYCCRSQVVYRVRLDNTLRALIGGILCLRNSYGCVASERLNISKWIAKRQGDQNRPDDLLMPCLW